MKSIISLLLNLQGKNPQYASVPAPNNNERTLSLVFLSALTNKARNLFILNTKFRKNIKRLYSYILTSDAKKILCYLGGYTDKPTKNPIVIRKKGSSCDNKLYPLQQLLNAIEMFEEPKKSIICMYFSGFYNEEIAQHISTSPNSVENILLETLGELETITTNQ